MPAEPLPTSTPAAAGVDSAGVLAFLDDVDAAPDVELHSLVLLRHGAVVAQGWWAPYTPDQVQLLYSLSKTVTATAAAFAVAEGLLDLDERVVDCFPELSEDVTDPRTRSMRVRHLASMSTGHTYDTFVDAVAADPVEPVRGFLALAPQQDPGTVFAYNQSATYTLAAILQRRSGGTLLEHLGPRLLEPLGIDEASWLQDRTGRELGFSGLHARTDAVARLGQLYLDEGRWQGRQLIAPAWFAEATRAHVATPDEGDVDWQQGYGFQVWRSRHGYRGDGAYGQLCLVLPEQDAVLAVTSQCADVQRLLEAAWRHLLPAMGDDPQPGTRDAELAARLEDPQLDGPGGAPDPARADLWSGAVAEPVGGRCADQPSLRRVQVERHPTDHDGHGPARWTLTLHEELGSLVVHLPPAGRTWVTTSSPEAPPVATAGGWTTAGTLEVALVFLQTPHRLHLTCHPGGGFEARWVTAPLHPLPLQQMGAPSTA